MSVSGPKPKPRNQIRHRNKPVHDWTEVPNVPFDEAPRLPPSPARPPALTPPEPPRPLGLNGRELWNRAWAMALTPPDGDQLLQLCEQVDERAALRVTVLRDGDWRERNGLRQLDAQVTAGLVALADAQEERRPKSWPAATKRWYRAISHLPHCALWTEAEWQFAHDTACLVAAYHAGNHRLAQEIRTRERMMGTTADARRDMRIRYVEADAEPEIDPAATPAVTAMADYRRSVSAL